MKRSFTRSEFAAVSADIELAGKWLRFWVYPPCPPGKDGETGSITGIYVEKSPNFEESQWNLLRYMLRKKVLYTVN